MGEVSLADADFFAVLLDVALLGMLRARFSCEIETLIIRRRIGIYTVIFVATVWMKRRTWKSLPMVTVFVLYFLNVGRSGQSSG